MIMMKEKIIINVETGEVIDHYLETSKTVKRDEFIQVYLEDISGLLKIKTIGEFKVLAVLWKFSTYIEDEKMIGNLVNTGLSIRSRINELTNLTDGSIRNIITKLVKKNILIKSGFKTSYYLNPKYFFKGKLTDRIKSCNFHIKYKIQEEVDATTNTKITTYIEDI